MSFFVVVVVESRALDEDIYARISLMLVAASTHQKHQFGSSLPEKGLQKSDIWLAESSA